MLASEAVVNDVPVPIDEPPVAAAYQFIVPAELAAFKVTVPVLHLLALVTDVIEGLLLTVATTAVLDAEEHPFETASAK